MPTHGPRLRMPRPGMQLWSQCRVLDVLHGPSVDMPVLGSCSKSGMPYWLFACVPTSNRKNIPALSMGNFSLSSHAENYDLYIKYVILK